MSVIGRQGVNLRSASGSKSSKTLRSILGDPEFHSLADRALTGNLHNFIDARITERHCRLMPVARQAVLYVRGIPQLLACNSESSVRGAVV